MEISTRIQAAIDEGEMLTIKYHGGSQPGAVRRITPLSISVDRIQARCHATGQAKFFMLAKLELVDVGAAGPEWSADGPAAVFDSLRQVFDHYAGTFDGMGWYSQLHDGIDSAAITLHRRFKTGKPMKGIAASLHFERYSHGEVYGFHIGLEGVSTSSEKVERQRPFTVRATGKATKVFSDLYKAARWFAVVAEELSPARN